MTPRPHQDQTSPETCSVVSIVLRGDDGELEIMGPDRLLRPLQPGRSLLEGGETVKRGLSATLAEPLHPSFPDDCWYLPGQTKHWSNDLDDFATLTFSAGLTRVYVLLPSFMNDPRWIYDLFSEMTENDELRSGREVELDVAWRASWATRLKYFLIGRGSMWRTQTLRVFKSNKAIQVLVTFVPFLSLTKYSLCN